MTPTPAGGTTTVDRLDLTATPSAALAGPGVPTQARYDRDAFVARYAAVWAYGVADPAGTSEPYYRRFVEAALAGGPAPSSVLDVGCGPGRVVAELAATLPGARCTAVDASEVMVDLAREILHRPVGDAVVVDAGDFGFPLAAIPTLGRPDVAVLHDRLENLAAGPGYDLVTASHLLDRVHCPADGVRDLARLVAPGGRLLVSCAFNYELRHQWSVKDGAALARLVQAAGLEVDLLDDAVSYRERLDARGTVTEHVVALVRARRAL